MSSARIGSPWRLWTASVAGVPLVMVVGTLLLAVGPSAAQNLVGPWLWPGLFVIGMGGAAYASVKLRSRIGSRLLLFVASIALLSFLYFVGMLILLMIGFNQ